MNTILPGSITTMIGNLTVVFWDGTNHTDVFGCIFLWRQTEQLHELTVGVFDNVDRVCGEGAILYFKSDIRKRSKLT